ncbi:MAG: hypothetical protein V7756_09215 [Halopseudomonas sp.]|uniref:hypothetical protein n=1 Tax=Halopseudomonas sp. TaxID=2901191 RepID=UPI0030013C9D
MSILRTDEQVDALEILKSVMKTAHFYRAMSEQLAQEPVGKLLADIAAKREAYVAPFEQVVKQLHELPAPPDADEEWLEELGGKIAKFLSGDSKTTVLEKCLEKDDALVELLNGAELGDKSPEFKRLIDDLEGHLVETRERIRGCE